MSRALAGAAMLLPLLAACDSQGTDGPRSPEVIRAMEYCDGEGLTPPLRHTTVFLDARLLEKSKDAAEFAAKNAAMRDIILSIAEPRRIQTSGVTALRERVTIVVVPSDGSPAQPVFEGCPPGLSAQEIAREQAKGSSLSEFVSGDITRTLDKQADAFTRQLIGGLNAAGARAEGGPVPASPIEQSPFLAAVRASKGLFEMEDQLQRLILVSDFTRLTVPDDRQSGIKSGQAAAGSFNHAEVHLVTPSGRALAHKAFLQGYFLAQAGRLASYSAGRVGTPTSPPTRLSTFIGEAAYPERKEAVLIRLAADADGKLSGSWLTLRGTPDRATPMTGRMTCGADQCRVESDDGGFAQTWSYSPSGAPRFDGEWPFAGMRNFSFVVSEGRISGRVYDEAVYIGEDTSRNSIEISGVRKR
jgi:hypothetical protein